MLVPCKSFSRPLKLLLLSLVLNVILILHMRVQLGVEPLELVLPLLLDLQHSPFVLPLLLQFDLLKLSLERPLELVKLGLLHGTYSILSLHHESLEVLLLSDVLLLGPDHLVAVVEVLLLLPHLLLE